MKVHVNYARKAGRENYGSENFSLALETEPPPDVASDREKLRGYIEALFAECKARVEDQVVEAGEREPAPERTQSRAAPVPVPRRAPPRVVRGGVPPGGRSAPHSTPHADDGLASPKQVNYLRSLGSQNGLSYGQVAALAEETFGKRDLRELTKKEASSLIDQLRSEAA